MKVLIAGGTGFLGRALTESLLADNHQAYLLTRNTRAKIPAGVHSILWDSKTTDGWGHRINEMDVVVHLAGKSLSSWPWTASKKRAFLDSRVQPGLVLASAIEKATHRPRVFIQQSGIGHYGLKGEPADESTPPGDDFLSQITVHEEDATKSVEALGVRRVVTRSAVVIARRGGLMPLMALPVQLFAGGPYGRGKHAMQWIHIADWVGAVRFLIGNENARGAYNLIAPTPTSNEEFNRALAKVIHRPYWFRTPPVLLRTFLGEMSVVLLGGRFAQPKRLIDSGYRFQFSRPEEAFLDLYG